MAKFSNLGGSRVFARNAGSLFQLAWLMLVLGTRLPVDAQVIGEGRIVGTVFDQWQGTPLAWAIVTVRGTMLAATTDASGRYALERVPAGESIVSFSKSGFARATVTEVRVAVGQTSTVDIHLRPEFYEMEEYEVTAEELATQEAVLLIERQQASGIVESIGEERFSRLAAGDAAEIMTKITGVSVVEGKFAVIRGLSDRYNVATLNGGDIPSSNPYRKSAQLDLFPSDVIESVAVSKTFTPDMPGSSSGGAMNIVTKAFPEKFVFKFSAGLGYNTQSTFDDDFLTYPGGALDAFGMDDGTRALPNALKGVTGAELQRLLSIAQSTAPIGRSPTTAEKEAAAQQIDAYVNSFGSPYMGPEREAPPFDHDFSVLFGETVELAKRPLGIYAGISYERDYRFYEDGFQGRYTPQAGGTGILEPYAEFDDSRSSTEAQWSSLVNLGYRPLDGHELGFNFLYVQDSDDQARQRFGRVEGSGEDQFNDERRTYLNTLHWTERKLSSYQLLGKHELPQVHDLRIDWLAGLANTTQDEPDVRYLNFFTAPNILDPSSPFPLLEIGNNNIPFPDKPARYWRYLKDKNINGKLDFTLPGEDWRGLEWKLKSGTAASLTERAFTETTYSFGANRDITADPRTFAYNYLLPPYYRPPMLTTNQQGRLSYPFDIPTGRSLDSFYGNSFYNGDQKIYAGYGMAELPVTESLRLIGGARLESTLLTVTGNAAPATNVQTAIIDQNDLLPAVSLLFSPRKDMNFRLSYSQTIARPTFREFAPYIGFDPDGNERIQGNTNLVMSSIQNFDARWEWFTKSGGLLSVGGFYKILTDPIEKYSASLDVNGDPNFTGAGDIVTFLNSEEATVWGVEFEARQNLGIFDEMLKTLSVGLNFAYIFSEVPLEQQIQDLKFQATGERFTTRPLYDQSPYIINADLSYDSEATGTSATIAFYFAAERLSLIVNDGYDVYEQPAPQLDFVLSQKLGKHWKVKFSAENLLNPEVLRSYAVNGSTDKTYVYSSYTRGRTFGLSFSYAY